MSSKLICMFSQLLSLLELFPRFFELQISEVKQACFTDSLSSPIEVKGGNNSSNLQAVLPANRASLSPNRALESFKLKGGSGLIDYEKKLKLCGSSNNQYQNNVLNLTSKFLLDETFRKEKSVLPGSAKKRKLLSNGHDVTHSKMVSEVAPAAQRSLLNDPSSKPRVKYERLLISECEDKQNTQASARLCKDGAAIQRSDAESLPQPSEGVCSSAPSGGDVETKGTEFLIQVKCLVK